MGKAFPRVKVPAKAGRKGWEVPDGLWRRFERVREARLKSVLESHVLPQLQRIEALIKGVYPKWPNVLSGKTIEQIEADPATIEIAVMLFDLAVDTGVLRFERDPGACGIRVRQVRGRYLAIAARAILTKAGHKVERMERYIRAEDITEVDQLNGLRAIVQFDPATVEELSKGFGGNLRPLLEKDAAFLDALKSIDAPIFLAALRHAAGEHFKRILDWDAKTLRAAGTHLVHSDKIMGLGFSIFSITDPGVFKAIAAWPMREAMVKDDGGHERKKTITRIAEIKKLLGVAEFDKILQGDPAMVAKVGSMSDEEIEKLTFYMPYLIPPALKALEPLSFAHQVGVLDGLWDKLGRAYFQESLRKGKKEAIQTLHCLVGEINDLVERNSAPKDMRKMFAGEFFDHCMIEFLRRA
ncbi:MAG: hypothetical protein OQK07_02395 [Rhodospirillales bacterium]|nr:hypothetical protein [Rhodospirillales bacterium]